MGAGWAVRMSGCCDAGREGGAGSRRGSRGRGRAAGQGEGGSVSARPPPLPSCLLNLALQRPVSF